MRAKRDRTSSPTRKRQSRSRWPWIILPFVLAAAAFLVFRLVPRAPASRISSLWAARGVEKPNVLLV
ncbi:MAG: hypothetical protein ACXWFJ_06320, partial [Candidatus Aminicenantales bacterium]